MQPNHRHLDGLPSTLTSRPQWVGFKVNGHKKIPVIADSPLLPASSTKPETWRPFETAVRGLHEGAFNALAYALNNDFIGIDLDDCISGGVLSPLAEKVVHRCASYAEKSFSGQGIHILLHGQLPGGRGRRLNGVELYGCNRFFICTGNRLPGTRNDIRQNPDAIDWLLKTDVTETAETTETTETLEDINASTPPLSAISVTYSLDELITHTLPEKEGERNVRLFDLARGLKFNMGFAGRPASELKPYVRQWHKAALPVIRTKEFDETWADFLHAYSKARHPLGNDLLSRAWALALSRPPPPEACQYDSEPIRKLVCLCAQLADPTTDGRFFLATRCAAKLLDVSSMTACRWMNMLVTDGSLSVVQIGNKHRATRYRWVSPRTPEGHA